MALVKNCIIVLLFALVVVGMIFYGVKTIEAKGTTALLITDETIYVEKTAHL
ncbi:hypothetical protein [Ferdinandcohnia sp. Marseille-Q9671]